MYFVSSLCNCVFSYLFFVMRFVTIRKRRYINELCYVMLCYGRFFFSHLDPHILVNTLVSELENLLSWIRTNKLSWNLQQTKCMIFSNSLDRLYTNEYHLRWYTVLEIVSSTKFLGLTIDNKLSWKPHIDSVCCTISQKHRCHKQSQILLFFDFTISKLWYNCTGSYTHILIEYFYYRKEHFE